MSNIKTRALKSKFFYIHGFFILLALYFIFHTTSGSRGILSYFKLNNQLTKSLSELNSLSIEKKELANQVNLLRSESLDQDMLDELARKNLGLAKQQEQIYINNN